MGQIFVKVPFALTGDKTAIPEPVQITGEMSFTQGYGPRYSEDPTTTGLRLEREQMNQLFYILSLDINQYQTESFPRFITAADNGGVAYSYSKYATVLYDDGSGLAPYQSLANANTDLPTVTASWRKLDPYNRTIERDSPAFTGTPTAPTAAPNDNSTKIATTAYADQAVAAAFGAYLPYKAMVVFDGDGGVTIKKAHNIASVTRVSAGRYLVQFTNPLPDADYPMSIAGTANLGGLNGAILAPSASSPPQNKTANRVEVIFGYGESRSDVGEAHIICF